MLIWFQQTKEYFHLASIPFQIEYQKVNNDNQKNTVQDE